ncbi:MAG: phosphoglycolate phosphatase [Immundisolibacteraceae bacterium]|nr:phosphoglycolate phosphatase [Immundisolibacteraceae bacterium]
MATAQPRQGAPSTDLNRLTANMADFSQINTLLFDLDGTLVDSVPDLASSINVALQAIDHPQQSESQIRQWVGNGVDRLLDRAITGDPDGFADPDLHHQAKQSFNRCYGEHFADQSQLYSGVLAGLSSLHSRGFKFGCVTNKPIQFTTPLLEKLGISEYFQITVGGDSTSARKPDPVPLLHALEQLSATPAQAVMIGDSINDFEAGQRAGMATIMVDWGYHQGVDLSALAADGLISRFSQLTELLTTSAYPRPGTRFIPT